jgi:hypothetical protein
MPLVGNATKGTIRLTEDERTQLLVLLERELRDPHTEARRSEPPNFQNGLHEHEELVRGLIDKFRPR